MNDGSVVSSIKYPRNKIKVQNSRLEDEVERETIFSTNVKELKKETDVKNVLAADIVPENMELIVKK